MSYDEDHIAMAAEYVLGTLDAEERAQVETMISVDPEFKLVVEQWAVSYTHLTLPTNREV